MVDQIIDKKTVAIPGGKGDPGEKGDRGLPGVNAVENDTAVAAYVNASDSETFQALAGLFQSTIIASGDQTGVADRTKIQAALDSGMRTVILQAPGEFYLDQPLIVHSHTSVLAYGSTIHYLGVGAMIRNSAYASSRTVGDVTTTAGSRTFTASGFTSGDVGSHVGVWGAGCTGSAWYGQVTNVSGTSITLNKPASVGSGGLTAQVFSTRDIDIAIQGGYWRQETGLESGHTVVESEDGVAVILRRIDDLTLRDMTLWVSQGKGTTSGRFSYSLGDISGFTVQNIRLPKSSGDGVHILGPAEGGVVDNVSGTTMDDLVALGTQDGNTPSIYDVQGDITGVAIRHVHCENSWSAVKLYDRLSTGMETVADSAFTMDHIIIDDVYGSVQTQGIALEANLHADSVTISHFNVLMPGNGYASVNVTAPYLRNLSIMDSLWKKNGGPGNFVRLASAINLIVDGVIIDELNSASNSLVQINGELIFSDALTANIVIKNVRAIQRLSGIVILFDKSDATDTLNRRTKFVSIENCNLSADAGFLVKSTYQQDFQVIGTTSLSLIVTNTQFSGQAAIFTGCCTVATFEHCKFTLNNALFAFYPKGSASKTNQLDITMNDVEGDFGDVVARFDGIGAWSDPTASDIVNVRGVGTSLNVAKLSPGIGGGPIRNNNNSLSCGKGLVIGDDGKWKNLYTGAIYTPLL